MVRYSFTKSTIFWNVAPSSLINTSKCFAEYTASILRIKVKPGKQHEYYGRYVNCCHITQRYSSENCIIPSHCYENITFQFFPCLKRLGLKHGVSRTVCSSGVLQRVREVQRQRPWFVGFQFESRLGHRLASFRYSWIFWAPLGNFRGSTSN
jgi:hypothetical protein